MSYLLTFKLVFSVGPLWLLKPMMISWIYTPSVPFSKCFSIGFMNVSLAFLMGRSSWRVGFACFSFHSLSVPSTMLEHSRSEINIWLWVWPSGHKPISALSFAKSIKPSIKLNLNKCLLKSTDLPVSLAAPMSKDPVHSTFLSAHLCQALSERSSGLILTKAHEKILIVRNQDSEKVHSLPTVPLVWQSQNFNWVLLILSWLLLD